jgi:cell wall-associated NlpC family hydrolase
MDFGIRIVSAEKDKIVGERRRRHARGVSDSDPTRVAQKMILDRRLHAVRDDLADERMRSKVDAPRYAEGRPARIAIGLAPVLHMPQPEAPLDTFYHYGEAVRVFDESDGYAWCQSRRDSYVGYVEAAALTYGDPPAPTHYVGGLGAYRYAEADLRSAIVDFLPRHSPVAVAQTGFECRGTAYVWLDGGGFLPAGCLSAKPPQSPDLAAAASLYLGCPYLWAGRSFLGFDCSGLVQEAFRDLGMSVPRDTDMQRDAIGRAPEIANVADLRRNDLIFVPGHVMICAGEESVLHAYGGDMTVRRDRLADLVQANRWNVADFTVRRLA